MCTNGCEITVKQVIPSNENREYLAWVQQRLVALEQMEAKLKVMRRLALFAARRSHSAAKTAKLQHWINTLYEEVTALERATRQESMPTLKVFES